MAEWKLLRITIKVSDDARSEIKEWLDSHCRGKFYFDINGTPMMHTTICSIWFELDDDKTLFTLTWMK